MNMPKWWIKSKVVIFNALSAGIAAATLKLDILQGRVDPEWFLVILMLVNAVNVGLRFITTQPVTTYKGAKNGVQGEGEEAEGQVDKDA